MTSLSPPEPLDLRYPPVDQAISDEAGRLRTALRSAACPDTSVALGEPEKRLDSLLARTDHEDWDGYGATAISGDTAHRARAFLNALPLSFQEVDIQGGPDGEVVFEWAVSPTWIVTLTIDERGRVAYSGLFGGSRTRGIEYFSGSVPQPVTLAIARVVDRKARLEGRTR